MTDCQSCGQPLPELCFRCATPRSQWTDPERHSRYCSTTCAGYVRVTRQRQRQRATQDRERKEANA